TTRRVPAHASTTASRSAARKASSPSSRKTEAIDRPKCSTIRSSLSTTSQPSRSANARLTDVFPVPLKPMRTILPGTDRNTHQNLPNGSQGVLDVCTVDPIVRHHADLLAVTAVTDNAVVAKSRRQAE